MNHNRLFTYAGILAAVIASFQFLPFVPILSFTFSFIFSSIIYLFFAYELSRKELSQRVLYLLLGLFFCVRLCFIDTLPVSSDDIYRYMWDGKVQVNGINPYLYPPNAAALESLHSAVIPKLVNQPNLPTIYFPFSEWIFYLSFLISGEHVWGLKILILAAEIATTLLLMVTTTIAGISKRFTLLYAACPLPIFMYALDAHVDVFGLTFLVLFLYLFLNKRFAFSLAALAFSLSIKPAALIVLPILFFSERSLKKRLYIAAVPPLLLIAQFIPYMISVNPFSTLFAFTKHWTFNGSVFNLLDLFIMNNQTSRSICAGLLMLSILFLSFNKQRLTDKIYFAFLLLLIFSPIVHPWYIGWVTVLIPLTRKWSGIVFAAGASVTSITPLNYLLNNTWKDYPAVLFIEYLPVAALLIYELFIVQKISGDQLHEEITNMTTAMRQ